MALRHPAYDIAQWLDASGILTLGTDLFVGPQRSTEGVGAAVDTGVPAVATFVVGSGGFPPVVTHENLEALLKETVQVTIRDTSFQAGDARARVLYEYLRHANIPHYEEIQHNSSAPLYIGEDENEHYTWTINITAWYGG